ncbi:MAG TPA: hypothetical protein VN605_04760 [Thermoanaerobaculia bacterium]|nr:hypothetical protein [Thermoanaerobaculia bacterium]
MTVAIAAIAVSLALPLLAFRGRTLRDYLLFLAGSWIAGAGLRFLGVRVEPSFGFVALMTIQLAAFSYVAATGKEVRWSATRAGVLALLVYLLLIPAMTRAPIDGDEPFYLLITESLVHDRDFDLRNQYADLAHSATGRPDLVPQYNDPVGKHGQQYSRHEPFLPILMMPGYFAGGLPGALVTIAIFGALLARATVRLLEDEGVSDATIRLVFPFVLFGPPIVFYAARIWPEVPAAWLFVEAIRGVRQGRAKRWMPALLALILLKLRFVLVGVVLALRSRYKWLILVAALPLLIVWRISGSATNVHSWRELLPVTPLAYFQGLFGLILDGMGGIAFQAPFYLLGIFAIARWRTMPAAFRLGMTAASLYVLQLIPRSEWYGGWSPPLRYITFLMPILALGAAVLVERFASARAWLAPIAVVTVALTAYGIAYPWRLFHLANGENVLGEALSTVAHSDFSRLFPSFVRLNGAAIVASVIFVVLFLVVAFARFELPAPLVAPIVALVLALFFVYGRKAGSRIDFEDAHVVHDGGRLYPDQWAVARFYYRGGWEVAAGDALTFNAARGAYTLDYSAPADATIELAGHAYLLPGTNNQPRALRVEIPHKGRVVLRCLAGAANLDRMERQR